MSTVKTFSIALITVSVMIPGVRFISDLGESIIDYNYYREKYETSIDNILSKVNGEVLSIDDVIKMIQTSPFLSESDKVLFSNYLLFGDILPYYQGTAMQEKIKIRLNNISVNYYASEVEDENDIITGGYYNYLVPNVLNLNEKYELSDVQERKKIITHEFIHLLQTENNEYKYIIETSAELIANEYYNFVNLNCVYNEGVKTLKLLIDIVGPEPILKGVFGGDFSELENILADNLSIKDYYKLTKYYFLKSPTDVRDNESDIREILKTLYFNKYERDIREDENILYDKVYGDVYSDPTTVSEKNPRIYLNKSRMLDEEVYTIRTDYNMNALLENNLLVESEIYPIELNLNYEEYIAAKDVFKEHFNYRNELKDRGCLIDDENYVLYDKIEFVDGVYKHGKIIEKMNIDDAIERGFIKVYFINYAFKDEELLEGWQFSTDDFTDYAGISSYKSNIKNGEYYDNVLKITVPGIRKRFNLDDIDLFNYNNLIKRL